MESAVNNAKHIIRTVRGIPYSAVCIPPDRNGDWSLKDLYSSDATKKDPEFATRLSKALREFEAGSTVYAPSVGHHSGAILRDPTPLTGCIYIPGSIAIYRNKGLPADGLPIPRRASFMMSAASCMTVVAVGGTTLIAAHGSRESMLDRQKILTGTPSRRYEGLVAAIVAAMARKKIPPSEISIRGYFSVQKMDFDHPFNHAVHGDYNQKMVMYVNNQWGAECVEVKEAETCTTAYLDMMALLVQQADALGVSDVIGECSLASNSTFANTRSIFPKLRDKRNLCIVTRLK